MSHLSSISGGDAQFAPLPINIKKEEEQKAVDEASTSKVSETNPDLEKMDEIIEKIANQIAAQQTSQDMLSQVIRILIELIPALQRLGIAEANQLNLSTNMQRVYTELIAKAPVIISGDADFRATMNNRIAMQQDTFRSYRDVWKDTGSKLQTNINATNDAVNQQIDLLTTFLQQLQDLTSLMTRGS